jgi:hypothetical protein
MSGRPKPTRFTGITTDRLTNVRVEGEENTDQMTELTLYFVVFTHRLRDVGTTIHEYDEHFWKNGHSPQMIVFDDSTQANIEKYLPVLKGRIRGPNSST